MGKEPARQRPADPQISAKFSTFPRDGTKPEMDLRRALHATGMRFRVQVPVPGNRRRRMDVAFTKAKIAVFVDGCFWHGCPDHGPRPRRNAEWWEWKISTNQARDADTDLLLSKQGWHVVRVWEHEAAGDVVRIIDSVWRSRSGSDGGSRGAASDQGDG